MLFLDNVANYCWGFVVGKTQTNEPWEAFWEQYEADNTVDYDFTLWQHDLFHPNLRPYDPKEIKDWVDGGKTALCPYCGIDSVIPDTEEYPLTTAFLKKMYHVWFT